MQDNVSRSWNNTKNIRIAFVIEKREFEEGYETILVITNMISRVRSSKIISIRKKSQREGDRVHLHEMTQFQVWIAVGSALHEQVRIYGLSYGSVFKSPAYLVHNEHNPNLSFLSSNRTNVSEAAATRNHTHTQTNLHTYHIIIHTNTDTKRVSKRLTHCWVKTQSSTAASRGDREATMEEGATWWVRGLEDGDLRTWWSSPDAAEGFCDSRISRVTAVASSGSDAAVMTDQGKCKHHYTMNTSTH